MRLADRERVEIRGYGGSSSPGGGKSTYVVAAADAASPRLVLGGWGESGAVNERFQTNPPH
jgi:hypothetical protein